MAKRSHWEDGLIRQIRLCMDLGATEETCAEILGVKPEEIREEIEV